jgi:hypothetical protein
MIPYRFLAVVVILLMAVSAVGSAPLYRHVSTTAGFLDAMKSMGPEGGTIELAPGVYTIEKTVAFKGINHINIVGSGWNTTLQKKGDGDALVFTDCGFTVVRNLLINGDGSAKKGSGIVFGGSYSSSCTVNFCRISGFPESGIFFDGASKSPLSSNTVKDCHFIGNKGIQLHSFNNNDFYIIGNQFGTHGNNPKVGCLLDHSSAGSYTLNYHWGNVNAMIMGPHSNFNRIENNRFEESLETGVIITGDPKGGWGCYYNIITGNTFHTNSKSKFGGYPAVEATESAAITFCSNQIFSWDNKSTRHKSSLIIGKNCSKWIVKDNIFSHNTEKPLVYDENAGHIVKDNIMD